MTRIEESTTPAAETEGGIDRSALVKLIVAALLTVAFAIFAAQNTESVEVEFLTLSFSVGKVLLMLISAASGIVVWELVGLLRGRSRSRNQH